MTAQGLGVLAGYVEVCCSGDGCSTALLVHPRALTEVDGPRCFSCRVELTAAQDKVARYARETGERKWNR